MAASWTYWKEGAKNFVEVNSSSTNTFAIYQIPEWFDMSVVNKWWTGDDYLKAGFKEVFDFDENGDPIYTQETLEEFCSPEYSI